MVAGICALPSEERQHPASNIQRPSHHSSHSTRSHSSLDGQPARSVSPGGNAKARALREIPWSEEEKEQLRLRAQNDPDGFSEWAATVTAGSNRRFALETAALAWGASDPSSAADWAGNLSGKIERTQALTHIAGEAVRGDPHLALELACSLPEPAMKDIVPRASAEWAVTDPAAATDWVNQFPDGELRDTAMECLARAAAGKK